MAQHDYVIANQSGSSFRSDLNNALSAIVSQNSGASEPSPTYAYQLWADTTAGVLKMRNGANSAWITLRELDGTMAIEAGTAAAPGLYFVGDTNTGIYSPGADQVAISTGGTGRLFVDSGGQVGVGTSPVSAFHVNGTGRFEASQSLICNGTTGTYATWLYNGTAVGDIGTANQAVSGGGNTDFAITTRSATNLVFGIGTSERARIDSSGRLLVGTSSSFSGGDQQSARIQIVGNSSAATGAGLFAIGRGEAATSITVDERIGSIGFSDNGAGEFARIECIADGTAGSSDYPGRLVFSTTADGASSPTQRMRITNGGFIKASNTGSYISTTSSYNEYTSNADNIHTTLYSTNASLAYQMINAVAVRAANSAYTFLACQSGDFSDFEFILRGDGNAFADGTWSGGGADYAEYFEWSDGNPDAEDRRGIAVVLDGDKIRPAAAGEDPIGVISGNPSVVGDAAWNKWSGKYLRDDYGTYIQEDYEVEDEDGNTVIQQRRKLNPDYDPEQEYINRENRPEWDCVGLMGKLRIRTGQPTGSRWIKMRDISPTIEEWLVR